MEQPSVSRGNARILRSCRTDRLGSPPPLPVGRVGELACGTRRELDIHLEYLRFCAGQPCHRILLDAPLRIEASIRTSGHRCRDHRHACSSLEPGKTRNPDKLGARDDACIVRPRAGGVAVLFESIRKTNFWSASPSEWPFRSEE